MIENKVINNIKSNEEGANHYQLKDVGDGTITSGNHTPYWFESMIQPIAFAPLIEDIETDIVVIGGGIAGLTTAYCLAAQGYKVTLIEDGFIGSGETGRTTAHLTCVLDARYVDLEKTFDLNTARLVAQSHNVILCG